MSIARANRLTPWLFLGPAAVIMAVALLYPLGYMVWGSFRAWDPSQTIGEAEFVGLKNYITLWDDPNFRESLGVTLKFAFFCVSIEMVLGVGLALLLDRNIRGMSVLRTMFILPMMIAPVVVGLMWRYMYHPTVGTFNRTLESLGIPTVDWLGQHALMSVIIADIWQWTPFIFILALAALQSLPRSALEAARIDGAGPVKFFIDILVPLSKTMVAAMFIIMFVFGWNQYLWPTMITTDEDMFTLVRGIKQITQDLEGTNIPEYGRANLLAIIAIIPPVMVVIFFQSWFVKGLTESDK